MSIHNFAVLLERIHHLFGFFLGNARIVFSLQDQKRRFDFVDVSDG